MAHMCCRDYAGWRSRCFPRESAVRCTCHMTAGPATPALAAAATQRHVRSHPFTARRCEACNGLESRGIHVLHLHSCVMCRRSHGIKPLPSPKSRKGRARQCPEPAQQLSHFHVPTAPPHCSPQSNSQPSQGSPRGPQEPLAASASLVPGRCTCAPLRRILSHSVPSSMPAIYHSPRGLSPDKKDPDSLTLPWLSTAPALQHCPQALLEAAMAEYEPMASRHGVVMCGSGQRMKPGLTCCVVALVAQSCMQQTGTPAARQLLLQILGT
jgi:hypothetical protein